MQDNFEYDKKIKNELQEKLELPNVVKEKIKQVYIKIEEDKNGERNMEKQTKFKLSKVLSLAASLIVIIFLVGNGVAYAKGEENIYSWILNKMGIQKEYEEIKTEINQIVEVEATQENAEEIKNYKVKMSLKDIGYDNNLLIAGWTIECPKLIEMFTQYEGQEIKETKNTIEDTLELDLNININNEDVIYNYSLPEGEEAIINSYRMTKCLSDNEILIYEIFILDDLEIDKIRSMEININSIIESFTDGAWNVADGNWKFAVKDIKQNTDFYKKYASPATVEYVVDKEYIEEYKDGSIQRRSNQMNIVTNGLNGKIEINRIINCKSASLMYMTSNLEINSEVVEPTCFYCCDITDNNGNIILEKTLLYSLENEPFITQEKLKEGETYYINIYKIIDSDMYYIQPRISDVGNGKFEKIHSLEFKLP